MNPMATLRLDGLVKANEEVTRVLKGTVKVIEEMREPAEEVTADDLVSTMAF